MSDLGVWKALETKKREGQKLEKGEYVFQPLHIFSHFRGRVAPDGNC